MLGCNESNIIFQQHLCKLGQLRRSNSQVFGQAMKKRPTGHYKKYSHFKGRDTAPTVLPYFVNSQGLSEQCICNTKVFASCDDVCLVILSLAILLQREMHTISVLNSMRVLRYMCVLPAGARLVVYGMNCTVFGRALVRQRERRREREREGERLMTHTHWRVVQPHVLSG